MATALGGTWELLPASLAAASFLMQLISTNVAPVLFNLLPPPARPPKPKPVDDYATCREYSPELLAFPAERFVRVDAESNHLATTVVCIAESEPRSIATSTCLATAVVA